MRWMTSASAWVLAALVICSAGCANEYALHGRVIEGPAGAAPSVTIVSSNEERLTMTDSSGAGATIELWIDEDSPKRQQMPSVVADGQGYFTMPVTVTGAGFLEYEARLIARRSGHQSADATFALPGGGGQVLVILPRGADRSRVGPTSDPLEDALRDGRRYMEDRP